MPVSSLTDAAVRKATAIGGRTTEYRDAKTPGIALRVTAKGSKSWTLRYRTRSGAQRRYTIGPYPAVPLALAREQALKHLGIYKEDNKQQNEITALMDEINGRGKLQPKDQ